MSNCVDCPKPECDCVEVKPDEVKDLGVEEARQVVAKAFPRGRGMDRSIAHLFKNGKSQFFRVNFYDEDEEKYVKSHFVEVKDGAAIEREQPVRKPGLWSN